MQGTPGKPSLRIFWVFRLLFTSFHCLLPGGYSEKIKENVEKLLGMSNLETETFMR